MLTTDLIMETVTNVITTRIATLIMVTIIANIFMLAVLMYNQHGAKRLIPALVISIAAIGLNTFDAYKTVNTKPASIFSTQDDIRDFLEMGGYTKTTAKVVNHYKSTNTDMESTEIIYSYTAADGTESFGVASIPNKLRAGDDIANGEEIEVYYSINDNTLSKCLYDVKTIEYVAKSISNSTIGVFGMQWTVIIATSVTLQALLLAAYTLCDKFKRYYLYRTPANKATL